VIPEHKDNVDLADDLSHEILKDTSVVDEPAVVVQPVDELAVVVEPVDDTMDVITDPEAVLSLFNGGDFIVQGETDTDLLEPVVTKTSANWNQLRSKSSFPPILISKLRVCKNMANHNLAEIR